MDKNKIKNKLKDDPAFTLEVQNPEVEALMTQYSSDKKAETLNKLIEKCTKSRFFGTCKCRREQQADSAIY